MVCHHLIYKIKRKHWKVCANKTDSVSYQPRAIRRGTLKTSGQFGDGNLRIFRVNHLLQSRSLLAPLETADKIPATAPVLELYQKIGDKQDCHPGRDNDGPSSPDSTTRTKGMNAWIRVCHTGSN